MLEDDFQEQKSDFGQMYMKENTVNPGMYILSAKKRRRFYVPPFTTRHYELELCLWNTSTMICIPYTVHPVTIF
ncbi:hypothetical protein G6F42_021107 [Rhizopus arrhizus]|nr:hypothetical protein G6F42_021107 [Rhizopus arrhizus]